MEIILINGLIASGKTEVGKQLTEKYIESGKKASFYDLDDEVERLNGNHDFESADKKLEVWMQARKNIAMEVRNNPKDKDIVVIVGPFYYPEEIEGFTNYLSVGYPIYLFTLDVPIKERQIRNVTRTHHRNDPKDVEEQEKAFLRLKTVPGVIVKNDRPLDETLREIMQLVTAKQGIISGLIE